MTNYDYFEKGYKGLFETTYLDLVSLDNSIDMQCVSYAIYKSMEVIRKYSERLCFYANLDKLPENVLDYLAIEWRLPYYDSEFSIDTKRRLLLKGFTWNMVAGTVGGVETLIQTIFQSGSVIEWFDFSGENKQPGLFDIKISNDIISPDSVDEFNRILRKIKNTRSHLRNVVANYDTDHEIKMITRCCIAEPIIAWNKEG